MLYAKETLSFNVTYVLLCLVGIVSYHIVSLTLERTKLGFEKLARETLHSGKTRELNLSRHQLDTEP